MVTTNSLPVDSPSSASYRQLSESAREAARGFSPSHAAEERERMSATYSALALSAPLSPVASLHAAPFSLGSEYESKYGFGEHERKFNYDDKLGVRKQQRIPSLDTALTLTTDRTALFSPTATTDTDLSTPTSSPYSALSVESAPTEEDNTPFPWLMVTLIASINLNDAFQMNCLWPFVPQMIRDFQFDENSNGFWCGVLASSYFLAQLISSFPWGVISDRIGRRPVLLYGTLCVTSASLAFGLASSFPVAIASRFLAGFLSGNLGTSKTYLCEELPRKHLARGLSAIGFSGGIGGIIGPVVGGYLNNPAKQYPTVFSADGVFGQFPYLLPELVSVGIGLLGFILAIKYLPESKAFEARQRALAAAAQQKNLAAMQHIRDHAHDSELTIAAVGSRQSSNTASLQANMGRPALPPNLSPESISHVCKRRQVVICTLTYGLLALTYIIYDEMFSFFFEADVSEQGLGYSTARTGSFLGVMGASLIVFQLLLFPWLVGRLGVRRLWQVSTALSIPFFLLFPTLSNLEAAGPPEAVMFGVISVCCFIRAAVGACSFTCVFMLINGSAPQSSLGAVNGLGQTMAAAARTVGPLIGGGVWSATLHWGSMHHFIVYAIVGSLCTLTYFVGSKAEERIVYLEPGETQQQALHRVKTAGGIALLTPH